MQFVSEEYKDQGVLAYSIHPGNIPTDIVGGMEGLPDVLKPGKFFEMQGRERECQLIRY
jgi:NAD(P)-dependent dehydrogenase (short-subunit alcohol dehydrogenase family)